MRLYSEARVRNMTNEAYSEGKKAATSEINKAIGNVNTMGVSAITEIEQLEKRSVAIEAYKAIHGQKRADYGPVEESYIEIAKVASIGCRKELTATDCIKVMQAVKYVREGYNHKRDNQVDMCGYTDLLQQLHNAGVE